MLKLTPSIIERLRSLQRDAKGFAKRNSSYSQRNWHPPTLALEQAPKKLIDFFDKSLLQHFDVERFLIVRTIPFERKAL
jgi:hypothetical protein